MPDFQKTIIFYKEKTETGKKPLEYIGLNI